MSEQIISREVCVEQKYSDLDLYISDKIQKDSLQLADVAIRFSQIKRVPRYEADSRESDVEHSFMLGLIAQEIADRFYPELDAGLIARFSLVHDLLELETGDIPTFSITSESLAKKADSEKKALDKLINELPHATGLLLQIYEEQTIPEARFVRMVDKLMPLLVDILGPGSQVMHEDYSTHTKSQLISAEKALRERFQTMFPDKFLQPLHLARSGLAAIFENNFRQVPQQETLF